MKRIAVYAGTFDPITNGHVDLVDRALRLYDKVIVGVATSQRKQPGFDLAERLVMVKNVLANHDHVDVKSVDGLLVDFMHENNARVILRGLRVAADFDYEFQLASMNRNMCPGIETVFLPASEDASFISSSIIREIHSLGGDISPFVPELVYERLQRHKG